MRVWVSLCNAALAPPRSHSNDNRVFVPVVVRTYYYTWTFRFLLMLMLGWVNMCMVGWLQIWARIEYVLVWFMVFRHWMCIARHFRHIVVVVGIFVVSSIWVAWPVPFVCNFQSPEERPIMSWNCRNSVYKRYDKLYIYWKLELTQVRLV